MRSKRKSSFTLIEIMIVVAILGLIVGIVMPTWATARRTAWKNMCITNLREIQAAQAQVVFNLPEGGSLTREMVNDYLKSPDPACPATGVAYDLTLMPPECPSIAKFPDHTLDQH